MKTATYFSDGAAERTRTRKRHFAKAVEIVGEFSLDHPNILGPDKSWFCVDYLRIAAAALS